MNWNQHGTYIKSWYIFLSSLIIKLQSGPSGEPADEVGLCLYGRVQEGQLGRNCFTRTAGWGAEELTPAVRGLAPSATFDVAIMCDPQHFKVKSHVALLLHFNMHTRC